MNVISPGHIYDLAGGQTLVFVCKKQGELIHTGTTNEELIEVLIDRLEFLQKALPCVENTNAINFLQSALYWLDLRTQKREAQGVEGTDKPHNL